MELLIRVVDRFSVDAKVQAERMHRGDVVAYNPDGWDWSPRERTSPHWRILRFPWMLKVQAEALIRRGELPVPDRWDGLYKVTK